VSRGRRPAGARQAVHAQGAPRPARALVLRQVGSRGLC
jgi:hypothetical protein